MLDGISLNESQGQLDLRDFADCQAMGGLKPTKRTKLAGLPGFRYKRF